MRDNASYYDIFASSYDRGRDEGYHRFLDDCEVEIIAPLCEGKAVLEVGCGTGRLLARVAPRADRAVGIDLSEGMLEHARARGLEVSQADATSLPFEDASFDLTYSFKVLAHVEEIERALIEMDRVTRPGGMVVAEFYNPHSLRAWLKRLGPAGRVGKTGKAKESEVFTRFDSLKDAIGYLPRTLELRSTRGIRVLTPSAHFFRLPGWARLERIAMRSPAQVLGGFLVIIAEKIG